MRSSKEPCFFPEYASSEKVEMFRYLSMLKIDIREFVSNNRYKTLSKIQEHARRRELELETQRTGKRQIPALSRPTMKKFKPDKSRSGGQRGPRCNKCGMSHEGACHALLFFKCGKDGHYSRDCKHEAHGVHICFHYNQIGHIKANCLF